MHDLNFMNSGVFHERQFFSVNNCQSQLKKGLKIIHDISLC